MSVLLKFFLFHMEILKSQQWKCLLTFYSIGTKMVSSYIACRMVFPYVVRTLIKFYITVSVCGLDSSRYKGHSFRIGAASLSAEKGLSDSQIRAMGRWNSNAFRKYIRSNYMSWDLTDTPTRMIPAWAGIIALPSCPLLHYSGFIFYNLKVYISVDLIFDSIGAILWLLRCMKYWHLLGLVTCI